MARFRGKLAKQVDQGTVSVGLREEKKREKMARIKNAARQLFEERGFEATTTKEIARQAGIGTGTLFLYVKDKRELLFIIFSDAVSEVMRRAFAECPRDQPLLEQLLFVFQGFFERYAGHPRLSRLFIKELLFLEGPTHEAYERLNQELFSNLMPLLERARGRNELSADADLMILVLNLFAIYGLTVVRWLDTPHPEPAEGVALLRRALHAQLEGVIERRR